MSRRKVFAIDGGAGRAIAAIPALKKYARNHPDEDWAVITFRLGYFILGYSRTSG